MIANYEELVYAGVLGKVIGVYMGRPFEGWAKKDLEDRFGLVDRYVHEECGKALVVADDDITGTFTFVRALEDSGLYEKTPEAFYGDTWLNYLIEGRTVLWWGGMGNSTEHTAYLRLKRGMKAPLSGAIETNGRIVAEQIGAQIFIDAFGMVAPGQPELAAELARRSARVSHDGEAVHGAVVVAAMVSAAFVEKDMNRLLDIGVEHIPADSLIAQVHRDVRGWAAADGDWRKTWERIDEKYGYRRYGGGCHMIPNHAVMVLAWAYAPDDFHASQAIVNTSGWDTDCNAANVGAVMGVKVGLEGIDARYDFRSPFADRMLLPTAEGTRCVSDCLIEAMHISRVGRKVMGWPEVPLPKGGAWHHFSMPGALHGYMGEDDHFESRGAARATNVERGGSRAMKIAFETGPGRFARVSTPVTPRPGTIGYGVVATPRLYPGMTVTMDASAGGDAGPASACVFIRLIEGEKSALVRGEAVRLEPGKDISLSLVVPPEAADRMVADLGVEITSPVRSRGEVCIDRVSISGGPSILYPSPLPSKDKDFPGWIRDADFVRGTYSSGPEGAVVIGKNEGQGVLATGTSDWTDYAFEARIGVHMAESAGIMVRYLGLRRFIALEKTADILRLVLHDNDCRTLAEVPCVWQPDELHHLKLVCHGQNIEAWLDGSQVLKGTDDRLGRGGAGFVFRTGAMLFRDVKVS